MFGHADPASTPTDVRIHAARACLSEVELSRSAWHPCFFGAAEEFGQNLIDLSFGVLRCNAEASDLLHSAIQRSEEYRARVVLAVRPVCAPGPVVDVLKPCFGNRFAANTAAECTGERGTTCRVKNQFYGACWPADRPTPEDWEGTLAQCRALPLRHAQYVDVNQMGTAQGTALHTAIRAQAAASAAVYHVPVSKPFVLA